MFYASNEPHPFRCSCYFIVAHPGHELRVHGILEQTRPTVAVLTDGSGSTGLSRLDETRALLASVGARPAAIFGALTDREAYASLMAVDPRPFQWLVDRVAEDLIGLHADSVVIDAAEGYNPIHDVCHWMGRMAIERAAAAGHPVQAFELDLVAHPEGDGDGVRVQLDEAAFGRKLRSADRYRALAAEAAAAYREHGLDAFRVEFLRRLAPATLPPHSWVPYYEEIGEARVREGRYSRVLRFATHVRPIIAALSRSGADRQWGRSPSC